MKRHRTCWFVIYFTLTIYFASNSQATNQPIAARILGLAPSTIKITSSNFQVANTLVLIEALFFSDDKIDEAMKIRDQPNFAFVSKDRAYKHVSSHGSVQKKQCAFYLCKGKDTEISEKNAWNNKLDQLATFAKFGLNRNNFNGYPVLEQELKTINNHIGKGGSEDDIESYSTDNIVKDWVLSHGPTFFPFTFGQYFPSWKEYRNALAGLNQDKINSFWEKTQDADARPEEFSLLDWSSYTHAYRADLNEGITHYLSLDAFEKNKISTSPTVMDTQEAKNVLEQVIEQFSPRDYYIEGNHGHMYKIAPYRYSETPDDVAIPLKNDPS